MSGPLPEQSPSVETVTCVVIRCGDCQEPATDDLGQAIHWPSVEEARTWLTEEGDDYGDLWEVSPDDKTWVCPRCVAAQRCATNGGHDWSEWRIHGDRATRRCGHCGHPNRRAVTVPKGLAL